MRDPCAGHPWSGPPSPVATSACSSSIDCAKTQKRAHPILECYVIFLGSKTPWCRQRDLHKREFPTRVSSPSNGAVTPSSGSNTPPTCDVQACRIACRQATSREVLCLSKVNKKAALRQAIAFAGPPGFVRYAACRHLIHLAVMAHVAHGVELHGHKRAWSSCPRNCMPMDNT